MAVHCSPIAPQRFTKPVPIAFLNNTMSPTIALLLSESAFHCLKVASLVMHCAPGVTSCGLPLASSCGFTRPVVTCSPPQATWKSGCPLAEALALKSRYNAGTRSTHSPLICSQSASCEHSKPGSFLQAEEQPSPSLVLPSSHSSSMTRPSPQSDVQPSAVQAGSV